LPQQPMAGLAVHLWGGQHGFSRELVATRHLECINTVRLGRRKRGKWLGPTWNQPSQPSRGPFYRPAPIIHISLLPPGLYVQNCPLLAPIIIRPFAELVHCLLRCRRHKSLCTRSAEMNQISLPNPFKEPLSSDACPFSAESLPA
jgi:hypothetical protein